MAYSELIKNFERIREYMREFYLYGFKSRTEYTQKSARSYDNERRRMESILNGYMHFRTINEKRNVFLSIDSRLCPRNPLYQAWKAKSFTDGDITLHFVLFDLLYSPEVSMTLTEITEAVDEHMAEFEEPRVFDESTVRKKLQEYVREGILTAQKKGKTVFYSRPGESDIRGCDALDFFSETAPLGVVGSFLLDKMPDHKSLFAFKHHYITSSLDSEILCAVFLAIREKRCLTVGSIRRRKGDVTEQKAVPLQIMVSVQSGRQYLMAYLPGGRRYKTFRMDGIRSAVPGEVCEDYDELRASLETIRPHLWGVSTGSMSAPELQHVEFTIRFEKHEAFILQRLLREKRCGTVEQLSENTARFSADVYDALEIVPWIRTFICRITHLHISDPEIEARFLQDMHAMYALYGLEGGEGT